MEASTRARSGRRPLAVLAAAAALAAVAAPADGQSAAGRRATTVESLLAYPAFHNAQAVRVRGAIEWGPGGLELVARDARVPLLGVDAPDPGALVDVHGTFLDVGRFSAEDPRLQRFNIPTLARERFGRDWPGAGDLLAVVVDTVEPAEAFPAPSVRALALAPDEYVDRDVTVIGRFRGRNLYGDLPRAPGLGRWDFVLQSADSAVWIVGQQPRGQGFSLDPGARVDTGRWLEVEGRVAMGDGLVWIEATAIALAEPAPEHEPAPPEPPITQPPPDVTFSIPLEGQRGVDRSDPIRVQFSRDMEPGSFDGRVRVTAAAEATDGSSEPAPDDAGPAVVVAVDYDAGRRVLDIRPAGPLPPFAQILVSFGEGIASTTGDPLEPWSLTFETGR